MKKSGTTEHIPLKVLVIDDSEFARKLIIQTLEKEEINVVGEAANLKEATEIINNTNANVLIVDVVMPDINGIELTRKLKEIFSDINVVMVSSLSQDQIVLEAISAGAVDFLHKPFSKKQLVDSLQKIDLLINN